MNGLIKFWPIHKVEYYTAVKMSELEFMYQNRNSKNILSKMQVVECLVGWLYINRENWQNSTTCC